MTRSIPSQKKGSTLWAKPLKGNYCLLYLRLEKIGLESSQPGP